MPDILTKRELLKILEQIDMDEPVQVMVDIAHLVMLSPAEGGEHLLQSDLLKLTRTGVANLAIGAGLGGDAGGVTLCTVRSSNSSQI